MRVALLAPTPSSLYSRATALMLRRLEGVELTVIVVRRMLSLRRVRGELRRDGSRLLKKIHDKLILGISAYAADDPESMPAYMQGIGLHSGTLRQDARRWGIRYDTAPDHNHPRSEAALRAAKPDLIVFTGGGLVRRNILELAPIGVMNCHSGVLPRYRGMDVVEWALVEGAGAGQVGLTTHLMDPGVDTGPILLRHVEPLHSGDNLASLRRRLEPRMVTLMIESVDGLLQGTIEPRVQQPHAGRQYFVMHPRLRTLAERALRRDGSSHQAGLG